MGMTKRIGELYLSGLNKTSSTSFLLARFGNIIGSNIFNILLILGLSGLVEPRTYVQFLNGDALLIVGGTLALFLFIVISGTKRVTKGFSIFLFMVFIAYILYAINREIQLIHV